MGKPFINLTGQIFTEWLVSPEHKSVPRSNGKEVQHILVLHLQHAETLHGWTLPTFAKGSRPIADITGR